MEIKKCSAIAVIFNQDKTAVLLVKRQDLPIWVLPGGGVEKNETPEDAVVREVAEETGLHVSIVRKIAEYTPINRLSLLTYLFECKKVSGELTLTDETSGIKFFNLEELPTSFFEVHRDWLQDALKGQNEVITKTLDNVTYWALFKYACRHPLHILRYAITLLKMD